MGLGQKITALFAALAAFLAASKVAAAEPEPDGVAPEAGATNGYSGVREQATRLAKLMGLGSSDRRVFVNLLLIQSYSESKGNRTAANKTTSEREAAKNMYFARENNDKLEAAVGYFPAAQWYTPGSAGWFGLMPTTLLNVVRGKNAKGSGLGPRSNVDAWASVVMIAAYYSQLVRRKEWPKSSQDIYAIKAGGAAGSLMDDPHKDRYKTAAKHVDAAVKRLGLPSDYGNTKIPASIFKGRNWLALYKKGK